MTIHEKLAFAAAEPSLTLDLYLPSAGDGPRPCVLVIQGGGYKPQDGGRFRPFAELFASHGFAAALISYRGRPAHQYRDTIADVLAAWRYVRRHADAYGIDIDRLGAMGRSAGATLAVLLGVSHNLPASMLDAAASDDPPGPRVAAVVAVAGIFDFCSRFTHADQVAAQADLDQRLAGNAQWIGAPLAADSEDWRNASAVNHVDSTAPPMLLMHARDDRVVPWQQSRDLHASLTSASVPCELDLHETGGHPVFAVDGPQRQMRMVSFLQRVLA